ncbi:type II CRISPR RNA-guided endonuclease Cas9 [Schleiferilactobacillus harbinensis]|uniref:type II CRISPR RNA-guided endonuclease Cas9 n=1 Tax=Schleiferilactobacillus harbinensis TaxID=304207 RepID=UPI001239FE8D|nr:type II CRISPR RNA-guided endonuclease Cas9 [Schleiferilactobacillus harbinensis]QEU47549.1 type II CRISPR RNA-guided endonuclease Cas9 [Schleiferilactobacillus harbinensis]
MQEIRHFLIGNFLHFTAGVNMHGQKPQWIFIEAAREPGQKGRRTKPRETTLSDTYKELAKDVAYSDTARELAATIKDKTKFTDLLTLYFQQNGRDIYTGKPINIDQLGLYQIDHIIPQAIKKDDSLDNRVLTAAPINNTKAAHFAADRFGAQMNGFWHQLNKAGLISNTKLFNLSMRETDIDKYAPGFIQRQLVETRQIIKLTTQLLDQEFGSDTKIVSVRASLSHQFRKEFDFPKIRSLNDYHHAFDAFLAARLGLYLLQRYPSLSSLFTYGDYTPFATKLRTFDFIGALASKEPLTNRATGEIVWDNEDELPYCDYLYGLKKILVVHEAYTKHGAMFKTTIYKRGSSDAKVPTKKGRSTNLYGGYTSVTRAYLAVVRIEDKKKGDYLYVMPVLTLWLNDLKKAYVVSKTEGQKVLHAFLASELAAKKGTPKFKIVADKVLFHQRVIHDNYAELIGGDQQRFNCQQLWLSRNDQQTFINILTTSPITPEDVSDLNN